MNCKMRTIVTCAALATLLLVGATSATAAPTQDQLVQQLASGDPVAMSNARVLLRQAHDASVAPKLAALLGHESEQVWRAASNALADQANMTGAPGREADRVVVADAIMALMAPDTSDHLKRQAMRLLPLAVPEGYDVTPVAAQLDNPELRERARKALEHINTKVAAKALSTHLSKADPSFQAAVLQSFAIMHKESTLETATAYLGDQHPPLVRAAAAHAVAWTGHPKYVAPLQRVRRTADEATVFDASDALLRLADNMARNGGNWQHAMNLYRDVLKTGANAVIRGGALVGLGRYGDETAVRDIVATVKADEAGDFFGPAMTAIGFLKGRAANEALLEAYGQFPEDMQLLLLDVFGRTGDPAFLGPLNEQVKSADPRFREAAIMALVQTGLPEAMDSMVAYAIEADDPGRAKVVDAIERMVERYQAQGDGQAAGRAYLGLYRLAQDGAQRQHALEGIQRFPTPDAFVYVMDDIGTDNLGSLSVPMLAGMAKALNDADRKEEARKAYDALESRIDSTEAVITLLTLANSMGDSDGMVHRLGFLTEWKIVGPFAWSAKNGFEVIHIGEPNVDLSATYQVDNGTRAWQSVNVEPGYVVDLSGILGAQTNATAFGYTAIRVAEACDAVLRVGSDDGIKAWVNGEVVHENNVDRGAAIDQDQAPIKLKAGSNAILVECTQGGGGWNFIARLTTPEGHPLKFDVVEAQ